MWSPKGRQRRKQFRTGTGLFWSLVGGIVIGRAIFFEPGVSDDFNRVASLFKAAIF